MTVEAARHACGRHLKSQPPCTNTCTTLNVHPPDPSLPHPMNVASPLLDTCFQHATPYHYHLCFATAPAYAAANPTPATTLSHTLLAPPPLPFSSLSPAQSLMRTTIPHEPLSCLTSSDSFFLSIVRSLVSSDAQGVKQPSGPVCRGGGCVRAAVRACIRAWACCLFPGPLGRAHAGMALCVEEGCSQTHSF